MFLTLEDPRAQVKGSRDPLAAQALWQSFGRHLVVNLTTVTTSMRNFTVHMLGRWAAERLVADERAKEDQAFPIFLRCECMGAYVRSGIHGAHGDIRGIEAVRSRIAAGRSISISDKASDLILGDQRTGGLWGLYTASARTAGLVEDGPLGLTTRCREFFSAVYEPLLGKQVDSFLRMARVGGVLHVARGKPLARALAQILDPQPSASETAFYGDVLRDARWSPEGDPGRQAQLAALMTAHVDLDDWIGRDAVLKLESVAASVAPALAARIRKVLDLEALLAPCMSLFTHLLARHGATVAELHTLLRDRWGSRVPNLDLQALAGMAPEMTAAVGAEIAEEALACAAALDAGDYAQAIRRLCEWNALVMEDRGSAAWVRVEADRLDVHYRVAEEWLPEGDELPLLWRNSYFLDALRMVTRTLVGGDA